MLFADLVCFCFALDTVLTSSSDDVVSVPFFRRDFPFLTDSIENIPLRGITGGGEMARCSE